MSIVTCLNCNVNFEKKEHEVKKHPKHFCSRSCAAKINNQGKRRWPPRVCRKCNKSYVTTKQHRSKVNCSECVQRFFTAEQAKASTLEAYYNRESVKGKHPSWLSAHIRGFNRSWNKELTKLPCQVCGYKSHVELAHIKAISDFNLTATLGEVNHPDNIFVLCPNHHWELDNGLRKSADIPPRSN